MGYEWDKKNKYIFSIGLMVKGDNEIIRYIEKKMSEGISRNNLIRQALIEKMERDKTV